MVAEEPNRLSEEEGFVVEFSLIVRLLAVSRSPCAIQTCSVTATAIATLVTSH